MTPLEFDPPIPEAVWAGRQASHQCRWQGSRVLVLPEQRLTRWRAGSTLCAIAGVGQFFFVLPWLSIYVAAGLAFCLYFCEQEHRKRRSRSGHGVVIHPDDLTWFGPQGIERQIEWRKVKDIEEVRHFRRITRLVINRQAALQLGRPQRMLLMSAASACSGARIEGTWLKTLECLAPLIEVLDLEPMTFRRAELLDELNEEPVRSTGSSLARGFVITVAGIAVGSFISGFWGLLLCLIVFAVAVLSTWDYIRRRSPETPLPEWSAGALTWTGTDWTLEHDGQVRRLRRSDEFWAEPTGAVESELEEVTMHGILQSFRAEDGRWLLLIGRDWVLEKGVLEVAWMPTEGKPE
jgi:hypothetical protein